MNCSNQHCMRNSDKGPNPYVANIQNCAQQNRNFRTALWTGNFLQMTLMCIPICDQIGLECHSDTDQFIRVEAGNGIVKMGKSKDCLTFQKPLCCGDGVFIPAGTWHNILNTGKQPLKLSSIYAPPHHPAGTIQPTKCDADNAEY
jgi:mannose-6-phosphate isomerase-like protein (cupin superfamily)